MNDKQIFEDMKNKISAIGGLMYQYRSCAEKDDALKKNSIHIWTKKLINVVR